MYINQLSLEAVGKYPHSSLVVEWVEFEIDAVDISSPGAILPMEIDFRKNDGSPLPESVVFQRVKSVSEFRQVLKELAKDCFDDECQGIYFEQSTFALFKKLYDNGMSC